MYLDQSNVNKSIEAEMDCGQANLLKCQVNMANMYNRNPVPQPFNICHSVNYRNHPVSHVGRQITAKLLHHWKGSFKVDSSLTPVTARLVDLTTRNLMSRAHVSLLKPVPHVQC
jgi:hypothetical protein